MPTDQLTIYDTTLRDGAQGEGVHFSLSDKLRWFSFPDTFESGSEVENRKNPKTKARPTTKPKALILRYFCGSFCVKYSLFENYLPNPFLLVPFGTSRVTF